MHQAHKNSGISSTSVHLIQDKATASTVAQTPGVHHPRLQCIVSIPATEDVHRVAVNHSLLWRSMQLAGLPCPFQIVEFRGQSWGLFDPKKDDRKLPENWQLGRTWIYHNFIRFPFFLVSPISSFTKNPMMAMTHQQNLSFRAVCPKRFLGTWLRTSDEVRGGHGMRLAMKCWGKNISYISQCPVPLLPKPLRSATPTILPQVEDRTLTWLQRLSFKCNSRRSLNLGIETDHWTRQKKSQAFWIFCGGLAGLA